MIEIHLSPVSEAICFFNSNPCDPAKGRSVRFEEIEEQWHNILNYLEGTNDAKIDVLGFDDPLICLIYLLKEKLIKNSYQEFLIVRGEFKAKLEEYDDSFDLSFTSGRIMSNLRAKWLF